jgi:hypothetical protein
MGAIPPREMKPLPFDMDIAIRTAVIGKIYRCWHHRSDQCTRQALKTYLKTYRELKKAKEIYLK